VFLIIAQKHLLTKANPNIYKEEVNKRIKILKTKII